MRIPYGFDVQFVLPDIACQLLLLKAVVTSRIDDHTGFFFTGKNIRVFLERIECKTMDLHGAKLVVCAQNGKSGVFRFLTEVNESRLSCLYFCLLILYRSMMKMRAIAYTAYGNPEVLRF